MSKLKFPPQIRYIIGNEAAERFSFYGMRAILTVFMIQHLKFPENDTKAIYHLFISASYFFPLIGGYIADRYWGKYKTIIRLSLVYCLGHLALALFENQMGLFLGLSLVAIGAGGIKPCVSAHVGDQFDEAHSSLLPRVYELFYFSINFGSFFSTLLTPFLLSRYGPSWAFGIPGVLMAIATFIFWLGRKHYVHVPPSGRQPGRAKLISTMWYAFIHRKEKKSGQHWLDIAKLKYSDEEVEGFKSVVNVFTVFITVSFFWALWDQHASSWVIQAEKLNRHFSVFGHDFELLSSQIQALNPIMVMLLIPVFAFIVYPLSKRLGYELTPLRKMTVGMFLTFLSFIAAYLIQRQLDLQVDTSVGWQVIAYLLLTTGEVLISITGLEFAYTQAPATLKSTIMSLWLLTVVFGNLLTAYISEINVFKGSDEFLFYAVLMFVMALVFAALARRYKMKHFIQHTNLQ